MSKDDNELLAPGDAKNNPLVTQSELNDLDVIAQDVVRYSEDDRRKSDDLYKYYQELISKGDSNGKTRQSLAKALELRENSVNNLVEILKLKTRIIEKKIQAEMKSSDNERNRGNYTGTDTSDIISSIDTGGEDES